MWSLGAAGCTLFLAGNFCFTSVLPIQFCRFASWAWIFPLFAGDKTEAVRFPDLELIPSTNLDFDVAESKTANHVSRSPSAILVH
jgi:hypothetical protein